MTICSIQYYNHTINDRGKIFIGFFIGMTEKQNQFRFIIRYCIFKDNHLKATGICKQCPGPVHKFVKTPQFINKLRSRTKRQMIGISQYYLATNLLKLASSQPFDSPCKQKNPSNVIESYIEQKLTTISARMHGYVKICMYEYLLLTAVPKKNQSKCLPTGIRLYNPDLAYPQA